MNLHSTTLLSTKLLLAGVAFGSCPSAQDDAKVPLKVAFVGDVAERTRDFTVALASQFKEVKGYAHGTAPAELAAHDVVVLDWQQNVEALQKWGKDPAAAAKACPLGARAEWRTPTVLLGSAGLNLACIWEVKGGFG